jgi:hypothetical protein
VSWNIDKIVLETRLFDGVLLVPKEYGMFVSEKMQEYISNNFPTSAENNLQ